MDIKEETVGRWPGILASLGIEVGNSGKHCPCPNCGGRDRYRFDNKEGRGTYYCNGCGAGDGFSLVMKCLNVDFKGAVEAVRRVIGTVSVSKPQSESKVSKEVLRKIYTESKPIIAGDLVSQYLKGRGLKVVSARLRFHPACYEPETHTKMPTMLATYTMPDGEATTIHRTFLAADAKKANIENPKKVLPPLRKMTGGAIRLFECEGKTLNVAEGIETALAIRQMTDEPVWSMVSSTLMAKFEPPPTIEKVVIFADNDRNYSGQKAAYTLANRLIIQNKIIAKVYIPDIPGDFLDDLNRRK